MAQGQNHYLADLREIQFVLFEQCGLGELLKSAPFAGTFDESGVDMVLDEAREKSRSPTMMATELRHRALADGAPRRSSASSMTSS